MDLFGPPNIAAMQARSDVPGLIKALGYKQDSNDRKHVLVRQAAAQALGEFGGRPRR